jgi:hypothetical protein
MTNRLVDRRGQQSLSRIRRRGVTTIDNRVWVGHRVVREAIVLVVDLRDPFLRPADVRSQVTQAILVRRAALDTGQRNDGVVEDPSNVRGGRGRGVGGA